MAIMVQRVGGAADLVRPKTDRTRRRLGRPGRACGLSVSKPIERSESANTVSPTSAGKSAKTAAQMSENVRPVSVPAPNAQGDGLFRS